MDGKNVSTPMKQRYETMVGCLSRALMYALVLGVARRVQLIPDYALRLLDWSPVSLRIYATDTSFPVLEDVITCLFHALACTCLDVINKNAATLYYWNPFSIVSALQGYKGMLGNLALLTCIAVSMGGTQHVGSLVLSAITIAGLIVYGGMGELAWLALPVVVTVARRCNQETLGTVLALLAIPLTAALYMGIMPVEILHRSFETIQPTIDVHWYLMAEVFPSFREYFSRVVWIMGMLLSVGLCLKFRTKTLFLFASHGMLCTLFNPYPCSSICALWMTLTLMLCSTSDKGNTTSTAVVTLLLWLFCVVTVLNVCGYQIWIQYMQGNANFFYGMNLVQGSVVGLTLIQIVKLVHY